MKENKTNKQKKKNSEKADSVKIRQLQKPIINLFRDIREDFYTHDKE